ncbi:MAG: hypothetical protein IJA63_06300 [Akkermansia sp.]|nr:hypothetical protein [Akkermansia sp.]
MKNIVEVNYSSTGESTKTDAMGMRQMQARAYAKRDAQYLLLKAPPASGKSRALMFLALYKLRHQGIRKVIVAVPECTIGASFAPTPLSRFGFFVDWQPDSRYNLCTPDSDTSAGKVNLFKEFMGNGSDILICTHATLRFAFEQLAPADFDGCLLAIDEFHHSSADKQENRMGDLVHKVLYESSAHIIAMTGSYFRGDNVPVMMPEDEARFERVVFSYYDQLNGYTYLKSLGIGHHFYQGRYLDALGEVLDTDKKTILHIPNVNSGESTGDKIREVGEIIGIIGELDHQDPETKILYVKRHGDGKMLKIADLVDDTPINRGKVEAYLATAKDRDDLDIIIALNKAKEGFDWPWCEHALTVGYRASLTEIIQIIGRATRDCPGKEHTQFTNLIAAPRATSDEVTLSVNNMLKAITASLLMEQVLAPDFKFLNRPAPLPGFVNVKGLKEPSTKRVKEIVENDLVDLTAQIMQDDTVRKVIANPEISPLMTNKVLIPKIISTRYPELSNAEIEEVRQHVVMNNAMKQAKIKEEEGGRKFVLLSNRFINVNDLDINLIDRINPFQEAYEILSKQLTAPTLRVIRDAIQEKRITMTPEEAHRLWSFIRNFIQEYGREPEINPDDANETLLAEALIVLKRKMRESQNG